MVYKIFVNKKLIIETNNYTVMKKVLNKKVKEYGKDKVEFYYKDKKIRINN